MKEVAIRCKKSANQKIRIYLNEDEQSTVSATTGTVLHVRIEQELPPIGTASGKVLFRAYVKELLTTGRISYGQNVPTPFAAVWEGEHVVEEDATLTFLLLTDGVHSVLEPEQETRWSKVRSYEKNEHRKIWMWVMLPIVISLLAILGLGIVAVFRACMQTPPEMPVSAAILLVTVYLGVGWYVLWQLQSRLQGKVHKISSRG